MDRMKCRKCLAPMVEKWAPIDGEWKVVTICVKCGWIWGTESCPNGGCGFK